MKSAAIKGPEQDGDPHPETEIMFRNDTDRPLEFPAWRIYLFSEQGHRVEGYADERDDCLEPSDPWGGELGIGS